MLAKVFENGRSQAVRIPKEYRFDCDEVIINKIGNVITLTPKENMCLKLGENDLDKVAGGDSMDGKEQYQHLY